MGSLGSERQIQHFRNKYSKPALKNYTKGLQLGFPHSVRTLCPNSKKNHEDKAKRPLLKFVSMSLMCGALRDLVPFVQFKKCAKHPWRSVTFGKVADLRLQLY